MRKCLYNGEVHKFHRWFVRQYPVGRLAGINGHGEGQVTELMAVLEDRYGNILLIPYNKIRFIDEELWSKVAEYCENDVLATEEAFEARKMNGGNRNGN